MLQAMNTGHEGSLATVHANTPADAVLRLETLASMTDLSVSFEALRDQINTAIEVFIQLSRLPTGRRLVTEVAVVTSTHREAFALTTVAEFVPERDEEGSEGSGRWIHHGLPAALQTRMRNRGLQIPPAFDREVADELTTRVDEP